MTIEQQIKELASLEYPQKVDVVDRVMAQVEQKPYLRPVLRTPSWQRISAIAVAAVVALIAVNVVIFNSINYDEEGLGSMIAQANDYSSWSTIEDAAVNPMEFIYEEEE